MYSWTCALSHGVRLSWVLIDYCHVRFCRCIVKNRWNCLVALSLPVLCFNLLLERSQNSCVLLLDAFKRWLDFFSHRLILCHKLLDQLIDLSSFSFHFLLAELTTFKANSLQYLVALQQNELLESCQDFRLFTGYFPHVNGFLSF